MATPAVSIVVPVYNAERFLGQAVESVLAQTFARWEILLVDDGSTDGSAAVARRYAAQDPRIRLLQKPNGGQGSARNFGIREAAAPLIAFLDADDYWAAGKLQKQLEVFANEKADLLYGMSYEFWDDGRVAPFTWKDGAFQGGRFFRLLYVRNGITNSTVLVRKSLVEEARGFDENYDIRGSEDWDLWMRISLRARKVFGMKERLVYYRQHPGGIHLNLERMNTAKWIVYRKFDQEPLVTTAMRIRQVRYVGRELMNALERSGKHAELLRFFHEYAQHDAQGVATHIQKLLAKALPPRWFNIVNRKLVYRIAYRAERLRYWREAQRQAVAGT